MLGKTPLLRRLLYFVLKLAIFMGLMYIVLKRWWDQPLSLDPLFEVLQSPVTVFYFLFCLALILPNWLLEAKIWQYLLKDVKSLNLKESLQSVLSGLTLGILTPFMTGDYVGRVMHLPKEKRKLGVGVNLVGSYLFTLLSIHVGTLGLQYFIVKSPSWGVTVHTSLPILLYAMWFASIAGTVLLLINSLQLLGKVKFLKPYLLAIVDFKKKEMLWVYILALIRYSVFLFQFVLMFWAFEVDVPVIPMIGGILLIFLAKTIGSGINIFGDLTTRELVGLGYFGIFSVDLSAVTWVIFLLWLFNIIIPAFLGFIFISKAKAVNLKND